MQRMNFLTPSEESTPPADHSQPAAPVTYWAWTNNTEQGWDPC